MPTLEWIGKDKVVSHHQEVPVHELVHQYGFTVDGSQDTPTGSNNMIIHGDNLVVLKSLLPKYEGRVDVVYIDPPYNTGNEKWVYNDNVNDPRITEWLGKVVGKEGEDFTRHDKWLCMMYPRLQLLKKRNYSADVTFQVLANASICRASDNLLIPIEIRCKYICACPIIFVPLHL